MDLSEFGNVAVAFAEVAHRNFARPAVRYRDRTLSYGQLLGEARRVSASLRAARKSPSDGGQVVAVVLPPGIDFISVVVGTILAGDVYLPIESSTPDEFVKTILATARPTVVVTEAGRVERLSGDGLMVVTPAELAGAGAVDIALPEFGGGSPAYVIYTSGSTGVPKGVVVGHGALLNSTAARMDAYGTPDRVPLLHSVAFDLTSGVVFWALLSGGLLVISSTPLSDVGATLELIRDEQITHLVYPASLYAPFLSRAAAGPPVGLRAVMIGSERWSEVLIRRHRELLPTTSLYNEYGPTEACVWTSCSCVYDGETRTTAPLTLGRPIRNTGYYVLDDDGRIVERSGKGELYITGDNLAIGYLGQPDLTAERFVIDEHGERAYRTGDLVAVTAERDYVFLGRADRQLKVQGNRVEAGHVETVLMSHPSVEQVHVLARNDGGTGGVLVAYVVSGAAKDDSEDLANLREFASQRLPAYMVPTTLVPVDVLPRTPSGKIDERSLPSPSSTAGTAVPADALEASLAQEIAALLGLDRVGVEVPLTEVGANSLAFVRISALISSLFGVEIPLSALFAAPRVRDIADLVRSGVPSDRPALRRGSAAGNVAPLSGQQLQIWFLHHLSPDARAYHTQFSIRLSGVLRVDVLERALSFIVRRHEILRTTFHADGAMPVQMVHPPWRVSVELIDLCRQPGDKQAATLEKAVREQTSTGFDISTLPLVRWHLYKLSDDRWNLLQLEHHFVHDGWSASLFLREIRDVYDAILQGREPALPVLPVQYGDYARWYHQWTETADFSSQLTYWKGQLAGCESQGVTFQPDHPRPVEQSFSGGCVRADVPAHIVDQLDELSRHQGATRFAAFLAAFSLLVWQHTAQDDLMIGSALSNRRQLETADMLGMFVNALPIRIRVDADWSVRDLVRHVMTTLLEAQDHQELPIIEIVKSLGLPRDSARNPLFQLMFAFHDSPRPRLDMVDLSGELVIEHNGSAKNDLNVVCVPNPPTVAGERDHNGVNVLWEYNSDLFRPETAQALLDGFLDNVERISRSWDTPIADLRTPAEADLSAVIAAGNGPLDPAPFTLIHDGVEAAIATTPNETAIVQGARSVTYAELDQLAVEMERQLDLQGIGLGDVAAVACTKSIELVVAWLGILRRGAAYLVIDPAQPASRLEEVLRDISPNAIIGATGALAELADRLGTSRLEPVASARRSVADNPIRPSVAADRPAYMVHTSGSTGVPKAVVATHRNAVTAAHARSVYFGPDAPTTLVTLPEYFDVAGSMIFWTLWCGGTVILPGPADAGDPDAIRRLVDEHGVTHVNFVASFYQRFLDQVPAGWRPSLKVVAIGGEACPSSTVSAHRRLIPSTSLHNEYGPTEATVWCSATCLHGAGDTGDPAPVTVGKPLANYAMYVLDADWTPVPTGALGELWIGGDGIAAGYFGSQDVTAERFVVVPRGPLTGLRLYRTGDRARLNRDHEFELFGRLDDQVKVRGYRIELGEVRQHLLRHPDVEDAFLLVDDDGPVARLIAYVVSRVPGLDAGDVRSALTRTLPAYMLPASYVVVRELPLTVTGKVDRRALPSPAVSSPAELPQSLTHSQTTVLGWWQSVLGSGAGPDEDFFACGGDSLQSIRLVSLARSAGFDLAVSDVLRTPTIRGLAARLERSTAIQSLDHRAVGTRLELTPIQGWFLGQDFAEPDHFNQARLFTVRNGSDREALVRAVRWMLARHDAFRTRLVRQGGSGHSMLGEEFRELEVEVLPSSTEDGGPDASALGQRMAQLQQELNLEAGDLYRAILFVDDASSRCWLFLVIHHWIVDAVSWGVLQRDVEAAYRLFSNGQAPTERSAPGVPAVQPAIADDAVSRRWHELVIAPKPGAVVSGVGGAPAAGYQRARKSLSKHASRYLLQDVQRFGGATTNSMLLAALSAALEPLTGSSELYTFLEGHGREDDAYGTETIGWLTSLYPALLPAASGIGLFAQAVRLQPFLLTGAEALEYGRARYLEPASPLGKLLRGLELPQITFNYLGRQSAAPSRSVLVESEIATGDSIGRSNVLPTPLDVTVTERHDALVVQLAFDAVRLDSGSAQDLLDRMVCRLEDAARVVALTSRSVAGARPHFLIHPVGGAVDWYTTLGEAMDPQTAVFGLAQDVEDTWETVGDLARLYVHRLRSVQSSGPYQLTGWSFGAVLAYEMARSLEEQGEVVGRVTLLDPPQVFGERQAAEMLAAHLIDTLPDVAPETLRREASILTTTPVELRLKRIDYLVEDGRPTAEARFLRERLSLLIRNHAALQTWDPSGDVAELVIIRPTATEPVGSTLPSGRDNEHDQWERHSRKKQQVHMVPGDHVSMLRAPELPGLLSR